MTHNREKTRWPIQKWGHFGESLYKNIVIQPSQRNHSLLEITKLYVELWFLHLPEKKNLNIDVTIFNILSSWI